MLKKCFSFLAVIIFIGLLISCKTPDDDSSDISYDDDSGVSYPYVYTELEYLGKANLSTSYPWPTDTEIGNALQSVMQNYAAAHPSTGDDTFELDGVVYEMDQSSITNITGGVPQVVFDNFWKDLKSYAAGLWSCWGYIYCSISSKGATSQAYVIYAICDDKYTSIQGSITYIAAKATIRKK
jgi:hypothetical protein